MGLLSGKRPNDLGHADGKFSRDSGKAAWKPNWVSSAVSEGDKHFIAPLTFTGNAAKAWGALKTKVEAMPATKIIAATDTYLHAESRSKAMGFVDDLECALDAKNHVIHVRAGARLGVRDFDVNRKRVEGLRKRFAA
jgi:uncharacterized protein (DUF1499 family)